MFKVKVKDANSGLKVEAQDGAGNDNLVIPGAVMKSVRLISAAKALEVGYERHGPSFLRLTSTGIGFPALRKVFRRLKNLIKRQVQNASVEFSDDSIADSETTKQRRYGKVNNVANRMSAVNLARNCDSRDISPAKFMVGSPEKKKGTKDHWASADTTEDTSPGPLQEKRFLNSPKNTPDTATKRRREAPNATPPKLNSTSKYGYSHKEIQDFKENRSTPSSAFDSEQVSLSSGDEMTKYSILSKRDTRKQASWMPEEDSKILKTKNFGERQPLFIKSTGQLNLGQKPKPTSIIPSLHQTDENFVEEFKIGGLRNTGNSCYANSVLQVIVRLPHLMSALHACMDSPRPGATDIAAIDSIRALFMLEEFQKRSQDAFRRHKEGKSIILRNVSEYNAREVQECLARCKSLQPVAKQFGGYRQQDAHEFVSYLFDAFELTFPKEEKIQEELKSVLTYSLRCRTCSYKGEKDQSYLHFSIQIPEVATLSQDEETRTAIGDMVDSYFGDTVVDDFKCDECNNKGATQVVKPKKLANTLVLHLKRFTPSGLKRRGLVMPESSLELGGVTYRLQGLVCHRGDSLHFGHYTSAAHDAAGSWTLFDDEHVERGLREERLLNMKRTQRDVYLLLYVREEPEDLKNPKNIVDLSASGVPILIS